MQVDGLDVLYYTWLPRNLEEGQNVYREAYDLATYYFRNNYGTWRYFVFIVMALQILIGIVACWTAIASLKQQGIAMDVRQRVIKMQVFFVIGVSLCDAWYVGLNGYTLLVVNPSIKDKPMEEKIAVETRFMIWSTVSSHITDLLKVIVLMCVLNYDHWTWCIIVENWGRYLCCK